MEECFFQPSTLLKVALLHGCFSHFLNFKDGTKLRKTSHHLLFCKQLSFSVQLGMQLTNLPISAILTCFRIHCTNSNDPQASQDTAKILLPQPESTLLVFTLESGSTIHSAGIYLLKVNNIIIRTRYVISSKLKITISLLLLVFLFLNLNIFHILFQCFCC